MRPCFFTQNTGDGSANTGDGSVCSYDDLGSSEKMATGVYITATYGDEIYQYYAYVDDELSFNIQYAGSGEYYNVDIDKIKETPFALEVW